MRAERSHKNPAQEGLAIGYDADGDVLLDVRDLRVHFHTERGVVRAVDGVNLTIRRHRTLGVVGESGCGKSVMALAIMGLIPSPAAQITGQILFHRARGDVIDLVQAARKGREMRAVRGAKIAMIFQEPMTALNPVHTVGRQIAEAIRLHQGVGRREARMRAIEMLAKVGIPAPARRVDDYPHQLSGGMRQRVMIAMALACNPELLICDEPTTALDVTVQAQILELMQRLQEEFHMAIVLISHDLGVVAEVVDEVAVMYLGQIVEYGDVRDVFARRAHPYTDALFRSLPVLGSRGKERLKPIEGMVPDAAEVPPGCRFAPRCARRFERCGDPPPLNPLGAGHVARCWLHAVEESAVHGA